MQAASRQSYAAALEQLDTLANGGASPAELRTVSDQLLAVARLLAGQVQLRRALSDPARPGEDRAALLRGLLGRQVSDHTRELLDTLVGGRWSSALELLEGCEQLAVQALFASSERAGEIAEVEDELFRFSQLVAGDQQLSAALGDRRAPVEQRATLVDSLLAGKAIDTTVAAVKIALGGLGGRSVEGALIKLVEAAAERRDRSVAYVTVATPLTDSEERRLGTALSARYGRDVSVKTTVDPRVLGGARVQLGADLYDGTVAHRLAQARNALASG
ncbi:F0F1 ATP synthase subunit delta [Natronosporangium hydrolyticum]|uniref:ATP synthase subunit delta n=1 Tax=Natronosporangium hydrolyticum TaxID=2811111 RepID=A0A895YKL9_9ACTN|nr:F0F1 ATP synthase subunit delta [Natronosporangium hydrolyticum]QSB15853.1 F0F1 ATP synthase subunit delta [Natronosporangium hydrolyticum]